MGQVKFLLMIDRMLILSLLLVCLSLLVKHRHDLVHIVQILQTLKMDALYMSYQHQNGIRIYLLRHHYIV